MKHYPTRLNSGTLIKSTILAIFAATTSVSAQETYNFVAGGISPPDNPNSVLFEAYLRNLEEASNGRLNFEWHPGNVLVPASEALDAVGSGSIDVLYSNPAFYSGVVSIVDYTSLPFFLDGFAEAARLFYDTDIRNIVDEEYRERTNTTVIQIRPFSSYSFIMGQGREVRTLSDFQGMKIRSAGGMLNAILRELGAVPVQLVPGEFYTGLQQGIVDGFLLPLYTLETYQLAELNPTVTEPGPGTLNAQMVWMNLDRWNELPEDLQELIRSTTFDDIEFMSESLTREDAEAYDFASAAEVPIFEFSDEDRAALTAAAQPVIDAYVAENGEAGARIVSILRASQ